MAAKKKKHKKASKKTSTTTTTVHHKKRRKKASKKALGSLGHASTKGAIKLQLGNVINTLQSIKNEV